MKFYQETTAWDVPNHVYLLSTDKSKAYGYIKRGTEVAVTFKKPYNFDARGRNFVEVVELGEINLDEVKGETWEVLGSKGDKYIVQKIDNVYNCSCSGFKFRGECKHAKQFESKMETSQSPKSGSVDKSPVPIVASVRQINRRRVG